MAHAAARPALPRCERMSLNFMIAAWIPCIPPVCMQFLILASPDYGSPIHESRVAERSASMRMFHSPSDSSGRNLQLCWLADVRRGTVAAHGSPGPEKPGAFRSSSRTSAVHRRCNWAMPPALPRKALCATASACLARCAAVPGLRTGWLRRRRGCRSGWSPWPDGIIELDGQASERDTVRVSTRRSHLAHEAPGHADLASSIPVTRASPTRFRPARLAAYSAASARCSRLASVSPTSKLATPTLTV